MKKITIETTVKKMLADVFTPVGIYLRLRDRYRDTILLESADFHSAENSYSFIGINAIAGIEIRDRSVMEFKLPGQESERIKINDPLEVPGLLWDFMQRFDAEAVPGSAARFAQGLYGYSSFDAVQFFDSFHLDNEKAKKEDQSIPYALPALSIRDRH